MEWLKQMVNEADPVEILTDTSQALNKQTSEWPTEVQPV